MSSFLDSLRSGGASLGTPSFTKKKSDFEISKSGKIKVDPITGEKIKPKDRKSWKSFKRNPLGITPTNSLDMNIPNLLTGENISGLGGVNNILSQLLRIGV